MGKTSFHNLATAKESRQPTGVVAALLTYEHGAWRLGGMLLPPSLLSSPYIEPSLRAFTLRLLSVHPE